MFCLFLSPPLHSRDRARVSLDRAEADSSSLAAKPGAHRRSEPRAKVDPRCEHARRRCHFERRHARPGGGGTLLCVRGRRHRSLGLAGRRRAARRVRALLPSPALSFPPRRSRRRSFDRRRRRRARARSFINDAITLDEEINRGKERPWPFQVPGSIASAVSCFAGARVSSVLGARPVARRQAFHVSTLRSGLAPG